MVLNSQELKKVFLRNCGKNVSEVYQVRRDNETIKEGLYQRFFCFVTDGIQDYLLSPDDQKRLVKEMGYYKNGKKDCTVENLKVINSVGCECDEDAIQKYNDCMNLKRLIIVCVKKKR